MQPFRYHVIVCTQQKPENVPCCAAAAGAAVLGALYGELARQRLSDQVIVSTTGCLGACDHGPVMVVYPSATWYGAVKPSDVAEIVSSHLLAGQPVQRLQLTDMASLRKEILDHREKYFAMLKARDAAGILPDDINELARSFMPARALLTALELDVFTAVGSGASAADVAGNLGTDTRATEMLLNALAALDLLEKHDNVFRDTAITARFLAAGSPDNARPALMHAVNLWRTWSTLTDCVRAGTSVLRRQDQPRSADDTQAFIAAMDRNAKERAAVLVRSVPVNGARRMLDLGGGSGAYSIAFVKAHPELHADILDVPSVLPLTESYISRAGLQDRISTREGDLRTDQFAQGYDLVLLSAICHMFSPQQNRDLLRRAYLALAPHGRLVLQDFILEPDKTSPRFAALFSLNMLVGTEGGASYSEPDYADWLSEAGFKRVERLRLPGPANLMIATRD